MSTEINNNERVLNKLEKLEQKIDTKLDAIGKEITDIKVSQAALSNDNTWIKWLFGGLLSFILVLLSVIITLLFKLVG